MLHDGVSLQPVGFVTFHTRAGAEAAKQDLQVGIDFIVIVSSRYKLNYCTSITFVEFVPMFESLSKLNQLLFQTI